MPGEACSECRAVAPATKSCCRHDDDKHSRSPSDPAGHCAICFFAARVSPPVVIIFTHPPLLECGEIEPPAQLIVHIPDFASTYLGRAPPGAC